MEQKPKRPLRKYSLRPFSVFRVWCFPFFVANQITRRVGTATSTKAGFDKGTLVDSSKRSALLNAVHVKTRSLEAWQSRLTGHYFRALPRLFSVSALRDARSTAHLKLSHRFSVRVHRNYRRWLVANASLKRLFPSRFHLLHFLWNWWVQNFFTFIFCGIRQGASEKPARRGRGCSKMP